MKRLSLFALNCNEEEEPISFKVHCKSLNADTISEDSDDTDLSSSILDTRPKEETSDNSFSDELKLQ